MKANFFTIALLSVVAISFSASAVSDKDKAKMMSLMKDASPYVVGMGKSAHEVCQDLANDMVKKYGNQLSDLGKTPSDIRESAYGICIDAVSSAESAKSMDEVSMWKNAAMQNINNTFKGDNVKSSARSFLVETIDHSEKMAKTIAFMMEINRSR
jgi:ABC-type sugar transport system substrate-binding protein